MRIEVLGAGCKRCERLYENVLLAASDFESSVDIEVKKVNDLDYFTEKSVFITPGLLIDGETVSTGKVLSVEEIKDKIKESI